MKAGKIIIYILLGLFAIVLLTALMVPKKMDVKKTVVIKHSPAKVFPYMASFEHMLKWNPWNDLDPDAKNTIEGGPMAVGSKWVWNGEKIGKGYLQIEELVPGKKVVSSLKFTEPSQSAATDIRTVEKVDGGSLVTWRNTTELSYPLERLVGYVMSGVMEKNLDEGLRNLKNYVNQQVSMNPVAVTIGIEGMTCSGCENTIKKRLGKLPGVMNVEASHEAKEAVIKVDSAQFNYEEYKSAIEEVGYKPLGVK